MFELTNDQREYRSRLALENGYEAQDEVSNIVSTIVNMTDDDIEETIRQQLSLVEGEY